MWNAVQGVILFVCGLYVGNVAAVCIYTGRDKIREVSSSRKPSAYIRPSLGRSH